MGYFTKFLLKPKPKSVAPSVPSSNVHGFQNNMKRIKVFAPSDKSLVRPLIEEAAKTAKREAEEATKNPVVYENPRPAPPPPGRFPNDPTDRGRGKDRRLPEPRSKSHRPGISKKDIAYPPVLVNQTLDASARVEFYQGHGLHSIRRRASFSDDSDHSTVAVSKPPGLEQFHPTGGRVRTTRQAIPQDIEPSEVGVQRTGSFSRPTHDAYPHLKSTTRPSGHEHSKGDARIPLLRRKPHFPTPQKLHSTDVIVDPPPVPPKDLPPIHLHHPYMYASAESPTFSQSTPSLLTTATRRAPIPTPSVPRAPTPSPTPPRIGGHLRPQRSRPKVPAYVHGKIPPLPHRSNSTPSETGANRSNSRSNTAAAPAPRRSPAQPEELPLSGFPTFPLPPGYDHFEGAHLRTSSNAAREARLVSGDIDRRSMKATVEEYVPSRRPPPVPRTPAFVPAPATSAKQDRVQRVRAITGPSGVRQVNPGRAQADQQRPVPAVTRLPAKGYSSLRAR